MPIKKASLVDLKAVRRHLSSIQGESGECYLLHTQHPGSYVAFNLQNNMLLSPPISQRV